jgi:altronate dehydratase small subunit
MSGMNSMNGMNGMNGMKEAPMRIRGIFSKSGDTVVTVTAAVKPGDEVEYLKEDTPSLIIAVSEVPRYHKISIVSANKGEVIKKYGERIGEATKDIKAGEHVHTHNLASHKEVKR